MNNENSTIQPGDLVFLKSGSPLMTVQGPALDDTPLVVCQWFADRGDGDQLFEASFHPAQLEPKAD